MEITRLRAAVHAELTARVRVAVILKVPEDEGWPVAVIVMGFVARPPVK